MQENTLMDVPLIFKGPSNKRLSKCKDWVRKILQCANSNLTEGQINLKARQEKMINGA